MRRFISELILLAIIAVAVPLHASEAATGKQSQDLSEEPFSRSEHWHSVLLYGEFEGPAFDNCFNRKETIRFIVSAENGGQLHQFVSLDYPEQPHRVFLGEIAVNQKELVLTAQAIHSYLNPARSYKFPIMNAKNLQLLNFESDIKTTALPSDHVVSAVTIKVTGKEGWFSDPTYHIEIVENGTSGQEL